MKFYYLPCPMGFISFSNNHYTVYNEKREAKLMTPVTNGQVYGWSRFYQDMNRIQINIQEYHKNKNITFQENGYIASHWIIK